MPSSSVAPIQPGIEAPCVVDLLRFRRRTTSERPGETTSGRRLGGDAEPGRVIGTLNEGALHAQLKEWYRRPGDRLEQEVDGYVVDLVRGDLLVEVQTGGFAPLRRKLEALTAERAVRLVTPVAVTRKIVRITDDGEVLSSRRSPKRGRLEDVLAKLVSFPALLCRPTFELEVVLTHEEERRVHRPGKAFRRHGWVVRGRALVEVEEARLFTGPDDLVALLPDGLGDAFDTADIAEAAGLDRRLAQQLVYCLRGMGACEAVGKRGRSVLYARAA
jgi:hypothetical protein